ncbi:hypothetical protein DES53_10392 [Roseimicrobium gellanilyticum]|uniref:Uncharacterized protein n=1 Tax=Roseimicrobium gellanilyticum TaxID=748857 RepID=A0A366HNM2_9BACT|nr:hypothetical protein [Roseimicrobium gellanilyticum]RBP45096.1 hypothetical protein DES53_10392 [Roseimicrobium gellanilyticum]
MSAEPPPPESSEKKHRGHFRLIAGGVVLVLLGALTYFFFVDASPPEDADLQPILTEGGGSRNPLVVFIEEVGAYDTNQYSRVPLALDQPKVEEKQVLEDVIAKNAFVFPAFEKLLVTDRALWRWPGDRGTSLPLPDHLTLCEEIAKVALWTKLELLLRTGEHQQAAWLAVRMHKFAQGLLKAEGSHVYYEQVPEIEKAARLGLIYALRGENSAEFLRQVQEALTGEEAQSADLIQMLKCDYRLFQAMTQAIQREEHFPIVFGKNRTNQRLWYQPQRTLWLDLNLRRLVLANLESDWSKAQTLADAAMTTFETRRAKRWHPLMSPNALGQELWSTQMAAYVECLVRDTACQISTHRMLLASIAVRRYELTHNVLPKSLQELTPEFLPAVPVDPMNLAPIQWNLAKRELLARGLRRPDCPAVVRSTDDDDIVFPLWWKSP